MLLYFVSICSKTGLSLCQRKQTNIYEELFATYSDRTHIPSYLKTFAYYSILGYYVLRKFDQRLAVLYYIITKASFYDADNG